MRARIAGERFWISTWKPRELLNINLGVARFLVWGPIPFTSLTLGWPHREDGKALQMYAGVKCDGSKSHQYGGYWMRLDWRECLACRWHDYNVQPAWDNQGGA